MFKSPPNAMPLFNTQDAVAISHLVSPEAGIITSFFSLKKRSDSGKLVFEITKSITSL